ncbi:TIGR03943 family protein [Clostridium sp. SYSU_GA19001]|uniref:TIGR03943 family putative permease subunit n=1 Tax=Clostridium caldaquaticum TaxID=2940653 RepID=UPI0020773975|nr:TIGR03943 family protein [Clostridium caldaquaticum]MCM8711367.1 TIGR03943 family protein [Clostridium caldaquaticum]
MKRFNKNEFLWFLILFFFTVYIYYLISTGKIFLFIHPKLIVYTSFSFVIFGTLTVFQFFNIFKVKTRAKMKNGFLLFAFALVTAVFIAPGGLTPDIINQKGVILVSSNNIENIGKHTHSKEEIIIGNTIEFNAKNYIHYLEELSSNIEKHKGKKVKISGFAYKEENLNKNEFMLFRILINCCAADSQVFGIMCNWDKAEVLEKDSWVNVEGILKVKDNRPFILVKKLERAEKPVNTYIYE